MIYIQIEDLYAEGKVLEVNQYLAETKIKMISENNQVSEIHVDNQGIVRMPRVPTPAPAEISIKAVEKVTLDLQTNKTIELEFQNQKTYGKVTTIYEYLGGKNIKIESPDGTVTHIETDSIGEIISSKKIKPQKAVTIEEPIAAKTSESAPTQEAQATAPKTVTTEAPTASAPEAAPAAESGSGWKSFRNWLNEFWKGTPEAAANTAHKTAATGNTAEAAATAPANTVAPEQNTANVASEAQAAVPESTTAAPEAKTNTTGIKEQTKEAFNNSLNPTSPDKGAIMFDESLRYYRDKQ